MCDTCDQSASVDTSNGDPIMDAYARYDSDPRVNGPDDFEAFRDAVMSLLERPA